MSAVGLPKPGTEYGPCVDPCGHIDCAETRKQSETPCDICGEPIGYDLPFYQRESWTILTHQTCLLTKIDAERNAGCVR